MYSQNNHSHYRRACLTQRTSYGLFFIASVSLSLQFLPNPRQILVALKNINHLIFICLCSINFFPSSCIQFFAYHFRFPSFLFLCSSFSLPFSFLSSPHSIFPENNSAKFWYWEILYSALLFFIHVWWKLFLYPLRILIPKVISLRDLSSTNMLISCNYNRLSAWGDCRPPFTISSSVIFCLLARAPVIGFRHPWKKILKYEWRTWNSQKFNIKAKVKRGVWDSDVFYIEKRNRWSMAACRMDVTNTSAPRLLQLNGAPTVELRMLTQRFQKVTSINLFHLLQSNFGAGYALKLLHSK